MTGTVRGLFVKPTKGAKPVSLESVVTGERGLEGDYHTRFASKRQILLMSSNILEELDLQPGKIFENVIVDGLDVMTLSSGQRLRMGESLVEVTVPCEPCDQMDRIRYGHHIQAVDDHVFENLSRLEIQFFQNVTRHEQDLPLAGKPGVIVALESPLAGDHRLQRNRLCALRRFHKQATYRASHSSLIPCHDNH